MKASHRLLVALTAAILVTASETSGAGDDDQGEGSIQGGYEPQWEYILRAKQLYEDQLTEGVWSNPSEKKWKKDEDEWWAQKMFEEKLNDAIKSGSYKVLENIRVMNYPEKRVWRKDEKWKRRRMSLEYLVEALREKDSELLLQGDGYGDLTVIREEEAKEEAKEEETEENDDVSESLCVPAQDIWPCECDDKDGQVEISCFGIVSADILDRALIPEYRFNNMTRLWSMYSKLGHLHKEILHGKTFEVLDLTSSGIESVEEGAFDGCRERLNLLRLTTNHLKVFPFKDLPLYPRLETLALGGNELESLEELVGLPELPLKVLYLGNNRISELHPENFLSVPHLGILELNGNNLTSIPPKVFMPLVQLESLYLYKNHIKHLATGSLWFSTPILRVMDARSNHMETVDVDVFRGVDYSSKITFDFNKFHHMLPEVFEPILKNVSTNYGYLSVMGTKLECDCDVLWIISNKDYVDHLFYARCTNRTYLDALDVQVLTEQCNTTISTTTTSLPLLDYEQKEEEEGERRREYGGIYEGGDVDSTEGNESNSIFGICNWWFW